MVFRFAMAEQSFYAKVLVIGHFCCPIFLQVYQSSMLIIQSCSYTPPQNSFLSCLFALQLLVVLQIVHVVWRPVTVRIDDFHQLGC